MTIVHALRAVFDHSSARRGLIAVSWVILLVGVLAYLNHRSSSSSAEPPPGPAAITTPQGNYGPHIPVPHQALAVARTFLRNGVMRQDLAAAWKLATPKLRGGLTHEQWMTGNIPVAQFPYSAFAKAGYKVEHSRQRDVLLLVYIFPRKGSHVAGWDYFVDLVPYHGSWRISYFQPHGHEAPIPLNSS
jgi:hypothetical protein